MVIRLHSIEAVNFRSLAQVTFEPLLDDRLTAIVGTNGVGKSSLVAAMLWAMYGASPNGVGIKDLRRQGTSPGDECRVTVTFEHEGQIVVVTRQLKGAKDATVASISVDGVETTATSVRAANEWVTQRLGFDADGFLAAVLVQQKQVDALVTAPPRERRDLVERLARIDKMGEAAQAARAAAREAQRTVESLPGTDDDLTAAETRLAEATATLAAARQEESDAAVLAQEAADQFAEMDALAQEYATLLAQHQAATTRLSEARQAQALLATQLPALTAEVDRLTALAADGDPTRVKAAVAAFELTQKTVTELNDTVNAEATAVNVAARDADRATAAGSAVTTAEAALARLEDAVKSIEKQITAKDALLAGFPADLPGLVAEQSQKVSDLTEEVGVARGEYERLGAAIVALRDTHDPKCPTCAQPIHDHTALIEGLEEDREKVKERGVSLRALLDEASTLWTGARERLSERTAITDEIARLRENAKTTEMDIAEARVELTALKEAFAAAQATADESDTEASKARAAAVEAREALPEAQRKSAEAAAKVQAVKEAGAAADLLPAATEKASDLKEKVGDAGREVTFAEKALAAINVPTEPEQNRVRIGWRAANEQKTLAATAAVEAKGRATAADVACQQAEQQVETATRQKVARAGAVEDYQRKIATRDALEAFRKDRLNRLAPELAEVTSDLVNRMTSGKYVSVTLDEDFTPTLTDDQGFQRPVSWLSGGEESLVALALRIAIGDVVFGATGGLLFLDEVLSAMDEFRRDATISAVRELPGRQTIMINHIPEAADVGDLVLRVVSTSDGAILEPVEKDGDLVHLEALETSAAE